MTATLTQALPQIRLRKREFGLTITDVLCEISQTIAAAKPAAETLALLFGMISATVAAFTYANNSRRERAKWAIQLYEKFYESKDLYKPIRETLDCDANETLVQDLVEKESAEFTDYLNFFEMVAFLVKSRQLSKSDVNDLFNYYLDCLKRHTTVMLYVRDKNNGFEFLNAFLGKIESAKYQ